MRIKHVILFLFLLSNIAYAQLQVNAGNDSIICVNVWGIDSIEIGGNPTATGGIEPYLYSWSTNYTIGPLSFPASLFLDDTTKSNPKLINYADNNLIFKLTVVDDIGTQAEDSIMIRFSIYAYLAMDCIAFINQGDTVSLFGNMGKAIEPLSFIWSPNYNISDTSSDSPLAWPDKSIFYYVYAVDSIGCISDTSICRIWVNTTGINSINNMTSSSVFPNPINSYSTISLYSDSEKDLGIQVLNSTGQIIFIDKFVSSSYLIGDKVTKAGMYFYIIKNDSRIVSYGQFVKD